MKKGFIILIVFALILLVVFSFFIFGGDKANKESKEEESDFQFSKVQIGESLLNLEIVQSQEDMIRGLSGRVLLRKNSGMLFVFSDLDLHGIWMKEMKFSIDILWLDQNFEIVHIKKEARPESYPEIFNPNMKSLYVLEINSGLTEKEEIEVGETLNFF